MNLLLKLGYGKTVESIRRSKKMSVVKMEYLKHVGDIIRRNRVKTGWMDRC